MKQKKKKPFFSEYEIGALVTVGIIGFGEDFIIPFMHWYTVINCFVVFVLLNFLKYYVMKEDGDVL